MMLHNKYQCSRPCGVRKEYLFNFCHIDSYFEHATSEGGATFSPKEPTLMKLVESYSVMLLTKHQGSRHCRFRQEDWSGVVLDCIDA